MNEKLRGVLFFTDDKISGYFVIGGEHFEIAGWRPAETKPRQITDEHGATSESECDPA